MIIVKLMGGLGNQMFQYATGLAVASHTRSSLFLDTSGFDTMEAIDTPRHYELDSFCIDTSIASKDLLSNIQAPEAPYGLQHKVMRRLKSGGKIWQLSEAGSSYEPAVVKAPKNTYLVGYWQNEKYFSEIREILLKNLQPAKPLTKYSQGILKRIENTKTTIAVHIRRGDYIANVHANKFHGLTPLEYYSKATSFFKKRFPDALFVVVSDDITWCRKNLTFGSETIFVEPQRNRKDYEDLVIMSRCTHNIIANSSFSWWGAWLNTNPKKIVIAPKVWFLEKKANKETEIVPNSWKRL